MWQETVAAATACRTPTYTLPATPTHTHSYSHWHFHTHLTRLPPSSKTVPVASQPAHQLWLGLSHGSMRSQISFDAKLTTNGQQIECQTLLLLLL